MFLFLGIWSGTARAGRALLLLFDSLPTLIAYSHAKFRSLFEHVLTRRSSRERIIDRFATRFTIRVIACWIVTGTRQLIDCCLFSFGRESSSGPRSCRVKYVIDSFKQP